MLDAAYLDELPEQVVELYSQAEQDILADMARRMTTGYRRRSISGKSCGKWG